MFQITTRDEYLEWPTDLFESFLKEEDELTMRNDDGKVLPSREVEELELAKRILNYVRHDQTKRFFIICAIIPSLINIFMKTPLVDWT